MPTDALAVAVVDRGMVSDLEQRFASITQITARLMTEGMDYGIIPGTGDKPTLFKPGAEKLLVAFSMAPAQPTIEDLSTTDEIRYRILVPIESASGRVLAVGCGECSSNEEKYRWRRPVCDEEWQDAQADQRREKWMRGRDGKPNWKAKQIRTSPADVGNTILKMAHKRGLIHGALMATAAGSLFNQDLDDLSADLAEAISSADTPPTKKVQRASTSGRAAAAASAPAAGLLTTEARSVKSVRAFGTGNFAVVLDGDPQEYTTKNEPLASEIKKFIGTSHRIRLSYRDNVSGPTTYHNIQNFVIADDVPEPLAPATTKPLAADDIPFGGR